MIKKIISIIFFIIILCRVVEAKVYIDINSPVAKQVPIAVQEFSGDFGKEISDIIKNDLELTGFFINIDSKAYIEVPSQQFNQNNWKPIGVEAVVKGNVKKDNDVVAEIFLYDVLDGSVILSKEYKSATEFVRNLSHNIANDIYHKLTGSASVFRTKICFIGDDADGKGLYVMDWDGGRISKIGIKKDSISSPVWSKDSSKIIYSGRKNNEWSIYLLDFNNAIEKRVFTSKGINIVGDFLPDGDKFVFSSSMDGTPNLYIRKIRDNSETKKITSSYGIETSPVVSPDGKSIAFVSDRGGSPQIYIMNVNGSDVRRLTFGVSYSTSPSWSPNGDKIAFVGRKNGNQIFLVKTDGTELVQLTTERNNEEPSFSPDARYIVFSSDKDRNRGIYIMFENGNGQRRITPKGLKCFCPKWSPK